MPIMLSIQNIRSENELEHVIASLGLVGEIMSLQLALDAIKI